MSTENTKPTAPVPTLKSAAPTATAAPAEVQAPEVDETITPPVPDELEVLKQRATLMGVKFHPSISVEKLKTKIADKIAGKSSDDEDEKPKADAEDSVESENARRIRLRDEATKLVRVNITCMNPNKREIEGEIITGGNSLVGSFKKFILFNTPDGFHVPAVLLNILKSRKCQVFITERTKGGIAVRKSKLINEFAIEVLPPLDKEELQELAARQAATHAIDK